MENNISDIFAAISLLVAISSLLWSGVRAKKAVLQALSPYLAITARIVEKNSCGHYIQVNVENLHHEIAVDGVRLIPSCFISPDAGRRGRGLRINVPNYEELTCDVIKSHKQCTLDLPILEEIPELQQENILEKKQEDIFVKLPKVITLEIIVLYNAAVYINTECERKLTYEITPLTEDSEKGILKGWKMIRIKNRKNNWLTRLFF